MANAPNTSDSSNFEPQSGSISSSVPAPDSPHLQQQTQASSHAIDPDQQDPATVRKNFWTMVLYQVLLRIGWIFKTETVVMPSFLDYLGGSGWIRGLLPIFNRFGQCVPPILASDWVKRRRQKKRALVFTTLAMSCCFLTIAAGYHFCSPSKTNPATINWMPWLFIGVYAVFFSSFGINQLAQNTLQGKIIPVQKRGILMTWASLLGVVFAVTAAVLLLPRLLSPEWAAFQLVFAFTGTAFLLAGLTATGFTEADDQPTQDIESVTETFKKSAAVFVNDRRFAKYALVASAFGMNMVLFPHYQALAKASAETNLPWLMPWLVAQNLGAAFFSTITGHLADRIGNAVAIRILMAVHIGIPFLSLGSAALGPNYKWSTVVVFFVLGATPVTYRLISNFTLELVPRRLHPRYLSSLAICLAIPPMVLSVPAGLLIDRFGFAPVFMLVSAVFAMGFLVMLGVQDPRHKIR